MKNINRLFLLSVASILLFGACNNSEPGNVKDSTTTDSSTVKDWKFGVALWTFHRVNFPEALDKVDSAGLTYIEPNTFHSAGPELNDSMVGQLSDEGIAKLKDMISGKGLKAESIYIAGDSTLDSWIHQFGIAKNLGVEFVTCEPPLNMWDQIDSLASANNVKVAIHEHWKGVSDYWNPDTTLLAIKDHPSFYVCADLGHFPKSGINPLDAVKKLSGKIIGIHLKDIAAYNDPSLKDVPVGTGVVDFPAIFAELKKQGFKGHIYIERDAEDLPTNLPSVLQEIDYYKKEISKLK